MPAVVDHKYEAEKSNRNEQMKITKYQPNDPGCSTFKRQGGNVSAYYSAKGQNAGERKAATEEQPTETAKDNADKT